MRRRRHEVVDVHGGARHGDAVGDERGPKRPHVVQRRVVHRRVLRVRTAAERQRSAQLEPCRSGSRRRTTDAADPAGPVTMRLRSVMPPVSGVTVATPRSPTASPGASRTCTLPSLNCSAPTPAAKPAGRSSHAQPDADAFVVERVVVADDAAVDRGDARGLELHRPAGEEPRRDAVPVVEARIAGADDDQIAVEDAGARRAGREDFRLVAEVPAEFVRRRRQRHDLERRGRHHQLAGVDGVPRLVAVDRLDEHAPEAALQGGRSEDRVDVVLELVGRDGGCAYATAVVSTSAARRRLSRLPLIRQQSALRQMLGTRLQ